MYICDVNSKVLRRVMDIIKGIIQQDGTIISGVAR